MLARTLEQLDLSERECAELGSGLKLLCGQMSAARQQVAACYDAYFAEKIYIKGQNSSLRIKLTALHERKQILDVKLHSFHREPKETGTRADTNASTTNRIRELVQLTASYEANEILLKRRYAILYDELNAEIDRRCQAEQALTDLNANLRGRILYLETWKQGASARVERLQCELNDSVPAL